MIIQITLGFTLIISSLGVILARRPVYAALSFLLTLLALAALYLQLSAEFISVMQVLVYAGAILVLFMIVIMLFQDAALEIAKREAQSSPFLLFLAASAFLLAFLILGMRFLGLQNGKAGLPADFGTVQALGKALYLDFFFPFEAAILLFLVAVVGALYIGRKVKQNE